VGGEVCAYARINVGRGATMQPDNLWMDLLFGNWIGLLSLGVIAFVVVMAVWIFAWFIPHQMDKH
jgi:hypothetical protein